MDKTLIWIESLAVITTERKGLKCVPIKSTDHEKVLLTVVLTGKADEIKLKPYVVILRKR